MKSARLASLLPLFFTSCAVVHDWNELQTAPMPVGDCYDGIIFVATRSGLLADMTMCDRGYGTWQSVWRLRQLRPFGIGRYRLRVEILMDEGSPSGGWPVRYIFEQQRVEDPRNERDPLEEHWTDDGQDTEAEVIFGERLRRRIGRKI